MVNKSRAEGTAAVSQEFARLLQEHQDELIDRVVETSEGIYAGLPFEEIRTRVAVDLEAIKRSFVEDPDCYADSWAAAGEEQLRQGYSLKDIQDGMSISHRVISELIAEAHADDLKTMLTLTRLADDILDRARVKLGEVCATTYQGIIAEREQAEQELRKERERLEELVEERTRQLAISRALADESVTAIAMSDAEGRVTYGNRACYELFGYDYDGQEMNGLALADLWPTEAGDVLSEEVFPQAAVGSWSGEVLQRRKDGSLFEANVTMFLVLDESLQPVSVAMVRDITERKRAGERLAKLNECLLSFGPDPLENISRLTALCGELLGATCALYNRLDQGLLCSWGQWNTPADYNPVDKPDGHICYDVIKQGGDEIFIVRNLAETSYAQTDPNVIPYNLHTYIGQAVKCGDAYVGSLCVVYQEDFDPGEDDKRLMGIVTSAIGVEEERKRTEEALRESEERFRAIFEKTAVGVSLADLEGRLLDNNPVMREMLGYSAEEFRNMSFVDYTHPDDVAPEMELYKEVAAGKRDHYQLEKRYIRKDERLLWVRLTVSLVHDAEGQPRFTVAIVEDITERKRLEQQIRESLERRTYQVRTSTDVAQEVSAAPALDELFRRVVTLVKERFGYYHAQVFCSDPQTGDLVMAEGYGAAGRAMKEAGHKIEFGRGVVGTAAASKQPVLVPDVSESADWLPNPHLPDTQGELAVPIVLRDRVLGVLGVQSEQAGYLSEEDQISLLGLCGQIASAIENTRLLEELARERNLLRTVVDNLPDRIYVKDTEGRFMVGNVAQAHYTGLTTPEEAIGKTVFDYYPQELAAQYHADEQEVIRSGQSLINREEPSVSPVTGERGWAATSKVPLRDEQGNVVGLVGITRDIGERKQAEAAMEAALRELSTLYRRYSREEWEGFLETEAGKRHSGYAYDQTGIYPAEAEPPAVEPAGEPDTVLALPLQVRGEAIGALELEKDGGWSAEEVALVEAVTAQVALSIESARLFDETQEALEETGALYQAASRISEATTIQEVLDIVGEQVQELLGGEFSGALYLAGPDPSKRAEWVEIRARWYEPGHSTQQTAMSVGLRLPVEQFSLLHISPDSHQPTLIPDVLTDERLDEAARQMALAVEARGAAAIPLATPERWLGFIGINCSEPRVPDERQVRLLRALADRAAVAIENRLFFERSQTLARREQLINEITARVRGSTDVATILQTAVQELNKVIGSSRAYIQLGTEKELAFRQPTDGDGDDRGQ